MLENQWGQQKAKPTARRQRSPGLNGFCSLCKTPLDHGGGKDCATLPTPFRPGATKGIKMKPFDLGLPPTTTLDQLKKAKACQLGYRKLYRGLGGVKSYGKTTPITYLRILEINGLDDCLWALSRGDEKAVMIMRWWAVLCSERTVGIYERHVPNDLRVRSCTETTKQFLQGHDAAEARDAARDAARGAVRDAAWGAIAALVAYDDAGQFMKLPVEHLRRLYRIEPHPMFLLLQPAAIVFAEQGDPVCLG